MSGRQQADLVICGLGYVGLALAREASITGLAVAGYDPDPKIVASLAAGRSHIDDVFDDDVRLMTAKGFTATTDPAILGRASIVTICVPTPLDDSGLPDLTAVRAVSAALAPRLRQGMLVVLESTSYPGTTEEVVLPILEEGSGLTAGVDFHLAYSPERIDPGNQVYSLGKTPKVVGGYSPTCTDVAVRFYSRLVETVVPAKGIREAEMAKLLENTFRYVNIAMVNELAMLCHRLGIDIWDVIACAATKPFGFHPFYPGPGAGGHCIPIDPHYLAHKARELGFELSFIDHARKVNSAMPRYVVDRCATMLLARKQDLAGARILLLGITYKRDIADLRVSPAYAVAQELDTRGAVVAYHDPYIAEWVVSDRQVPRAEDLKVGLHVADLAILLQDHRVYSPAVLASQAQLLFDARGLFAARSPGGHVEVL